MRQGRICRDPSGCDRPALKGAFMCEVHLADKRRCEGRVTLEDGTTRQCKKSALPGLAVCRHHGGSGPTSQEVSHRTAALTAMQRFVQPFQGALDPISAFEAEFRRTYGRIQWLEEQIASLSDEDLIWGLAKEEHVNAAEFAGINRTYEARVHLYEDMLWKERKHLVEMEKIWLRANLEDRKISMMRDHISYTYSKVIEAARVLGHDPTDPATRERLARLFTGDSGDAGVGTLEP